MPGKVSLLRRPHCPGTLRRACIAAALAVPMTVPGSVSGQDCLATAQGSTIRIELEGPRRRPSGWAASGSLERSRHPRIVGEVLSVSEDSLRILPQEPTAVLPFGAVREGSALAVARTDIREIRVRCPVARPAAAGMKRGALIGGVSLGMMGLAIGASASSDGGDIVGSEAVGIFAAAGLGAGMVLGAAIGAAFPIESRWREVSPASLAITVAPSPGASARWSLGVRIFDGGLP